MAVAPRTGSAYMMQYDACVLATRRRWWCRGGGWRQLTQPYEVSRMARCQAAATATAKALLFGTRAVVAPPPHRARRLLWSLLIHVSRPSPCPCVAETAPWSESCWERESAVRWDMRGGERRVSCTAALIVRSFVMGRAVARGLILSLSRLRARSGVRGGG